MPRLLVYLTSAIVGWCTVSIAAQPARGFLSKPSPDAIRVLTWNVYRNSIMQSGNEAAGDVSRTARFARVLKALQPDVVCLQEITAGARRTVALVDRILPLEKGSRWQGHGAGDTVIVSRFPIGERSGGRVEAGNRRRGHAIALIDSPIAALYMICAHFQSSDDPEDAAMRHRQAQLVISTIREARAGRGPVPLRSRTPFIILGDFNAIPGGATFVDAMVSASASPALPAEGGNGLDWDGSALTDAGPHHNVSRPEVYTWRNDREPFPPGALDRILYSDSVLTSVNQFVLDTTMMSEAELADSGLRAGDVMRDPEAGIHDHFPLVIDLVVRSDKGL